MRESIQDVARQTPSQEGPSCHFFLSFLPVFLFHAPAGPA